jgi:hypothetical protein
VWPSLVQAPPAQGFDIRLADLDALDIAGGLIRAELGDMLFPHNLGALPFDPVRQLVQTLASHSDRGLIEKQGEHVFFVFGAAQFRIRQCAPVAVLETKAQHQLRA